ncbi:retrovirus-related Pol polyprotein from transposon TNT 1-94 [Trichonephila clavipes]|nr:retrovirus-related Pol polyprotein from transposon TNT 1-94 [Trichonephila clavipes]
MDGINETFYCKRKNEEQTRLCYICRKSNHLAKDCYYRNKNSPSTSQRKNLSRNGHVFTASHREEKLCDNIWILDSGASCHMAKESEISYHMAKLLVQNESNGKAQRANRVLLERARSLLYESKLPLKFWAAAINCSTQVSNVTPRKGKEKIPLEIWTGEIENETWDIDSFFEVSPERNEINQNTENEVLYNFDINNGPGAIENDNSIPLQTTSSPRTGRIQIPVLELNDVQNQIPVRRSERLKSKLMSVHLVNNVPNSYFEAENSANWKNWKLAMENELDSLDKHKVWEIVQKPAKSKLIKTKWVYSLKQDDAGKNTKYKQGL